LPSAPRHVTAAPSAMVGLLPFFYVPLGLAARRDRGPVGVAPLLAKVTFRSWLPFRLAPDEPCHRPAPPHWRERELPACRSMPRYRRYDRGVAARRVTHAELDRACGRSADGAPLNMIGSISARTGALDELFTACRGRGSAIGAGGKRNRHGFALP